MSAFYYLTGTSVFVKHQSIKKKHLSATGCIFQQRPVMCCSHGGEATLLIIHDKQQQLTLSVFGFITFHQFNRVE